MEGLGGRGSGGRCFVRFVQTRLLSSCLKGWPRFQSTKNILYIYLPLPAQSKFRGVSELFSFSILMFMALLLGSATRCLISLHAEKHGQTLGVKGSTCPSSGGELGQVPVPLHASCVTSSKSLITLELDHHLF